MYFDPNFLIGNSSALKGVTAIGFAKIDTSEPAVKFPAPKTLPPSEAFIIKEKTVRIKNFSSMKLMNKMNIKFQSKMLKRQS